jgi:broad specificity phosphatase PhoE
MKLFLLRHGDRSSGYGDVPLSSEGNRQAQDLASQPALQNIDVILVSPKVRTRQTVQPLAEKHGVEVRVEQDLDQRKSIETPNEFTGRVMRAMNDIAENYAGKNVLVCSHSDWLQTAVLSMPSSRPDNAIHCFFSCADFKTVVYKDGLWDVT